ncbi:MAG: hypothetical protein FWG50_04355 [Kiritimatiellaeota bacterium]|nr:hypothetical protein [Kiritimatiellota bacterium]
MKTLWSFIFLIAPFLTTLCVIAGPLYAFWVIFSNADGRGCFLCSHALTQPIASVVNIFVPLGLVFHVSAIVLSIFKFKESILHSILQFFVFLPVSAFTFLFGKFICALWGNGYTLSDLIWWLFWK